MRKRVSAFSLFALFLFITSFYQPTNANTKQKSASNKSALTISDAVCEFFDAVAERAKKALFWLPPEKYSKAELKKPKILMLPTKISELINIFKLLAAVDYKKLDSERYLDFMLLAHYLAGLIEEYKVSAPYATDPRIFLPPFYSTFFSPKRLPDKRRAQYIISIFERIAEYLRVAKKYLEKPHLEFLNDSINRLKKFRQFWSKPTIKKFLAKLKPATFKMRFETALQNALKNAADFLKFLEGLRASAKKLTEREKKQRERFYYLKRLRYTHFIPETPEELREFAQNEYKKIDRKMCTIARVLTKSEDWRKLIEKMKAAHPKEEELMAIAKRQLEEAKSFVKFSGVFPIPPRAFDVEVKKYRAKHANANTPYAFYLPVGKKPEQKGRYMLAFAPKNIPVKIKESRLRDFYLERMRIITAHECMPGHHLQFSYALTKERSEIQRRLGYSTVYVEGWGLYTEQIMGELGFYKGLLGKLAMLKMRLWRCARVIIDVGLHYFDMREKEAVDLLKNKVLLEEINAKAEVKRYKTSPTQPLSYLYGWREINKMRAKWRRLCQQTGRKFSLYGFHKAFFDYPFIPPYLLYAAIFGEYKPPICNFAKLLKNNQPETQHK